MAITAVEFSLQSMSDARIDFLSFSIDNNVLYLYDVDDEHYYTFVHCMCRHYSVYRELRILTQWVLPYVQPMVVNLANIP